MMAVFFCLFLWQNISHAQDFLEQFPDHKQTAFFDFRYKRDSPQIPKIANFADGFVKLLDRDFYQFNFDYPIRVLVLENRAQFKEFLTQELRIDEPPNFGMYVPPFKLFATYEDSGIGTFTHEILHPLVESNLTARPLWAMEGIPTFFEKFYGYWKDHELVVFWGFQNPWRIAQIGTNLTHLDLRAIISESPSSTNFRLVERSESNLRMASVFLWEQGCFRRFLTLIARHDKAGYPTYFEAAMGMQVEQILPLWQNYLDRAAARRTEILSLPLSTICDDETSFWNFATAHGLPLDQPRQHD
jgi:hypothetical protein